MAKRAGDEQLMGSDLTKDRDYLNRRFSEMKTEFSSFRSHYKELTDFIDPRRGRYFTEDRNKGDKRHKNIINNTGGMALRTATAGMMAGAVSPSRPWFEWTTMDKDLMRSHAVKMWLRMFQRIILLIVAKSNFYNMAPSLIKELLQFGTGCMTHVDDFDDVARFYTHTAGSYMIAQNHKLEVNVLGREFQMTISQLVTQFGLDKVSPAVRAQWDRGNYGQWCTVRHFIELNPYRDEELGQLNSEFLPYRSVYFEESTSTADAKQIFLSRKGFKGFPAYVPRWTTAGEDIYGTDCPGMTSLGDIKQLQQEEKDLAKAKAKQNTPPLQGPPSLRNQPVTNLPGGVTINTMPGQGKIEPLYQVDPRVQEILQGIDNIQRRIEKAFFVDIFMAITEMAGIQPKNELQLSQINEERLLQLGPVLEQVHGEWLSRTVRRVAQQVLDAGIMPDAPEELQGKELDVEFVSALAMAQKSVIISGIERTLNFATGMANSGFENILDKVDADKAFEEYAELVGAPARLIVPDEEVREKRRIREEQMNRAQQLEMGQQAANIAKMASDAKLGDDNVLSSAVGRDR